MFQRSDPIVSHRRQIAEYFVVCGLPDSPTPYDLSKCSLLTEEIMSDKSNDSCHYHVPIVDIQLVSLKKGEHGPPHYHVLKKTCSGRYDANIKGPMGDDVYLCYRRSWNEPPITSISIVEKDAQNLNGVTLLEKTLNGSSANLRFMPFKQAYLSYRTAGPSTGIDELAVVDLSMVIPHKEVCPPAFKRISEGLNHMIGSWICLSFRKSVVKRYTTAYEPEILFSYRIPLLPAGSLPNADSLASSSVSEDPSIQKVANFCLPWGSSIDSWSEDQDPPQPHHVSFVLTNEKSERLYGIAFTFHEPYDTRKLDKEKCYLLDIDPELILTPNRLPNGESDEESEHPRDPRVEQRIHDHQGHFIRSRVGNRVIGVTKSMCILSRWSFPVAFTNFLAFLYSRCLPEASGDRIPLERYLTHFLFEVPFPDQITPDILVNLCAAPIFLQLKNEATYSSNNDSFFHLLHHLGVDVTLKVFMYMLTEQKVLLTSVKHYLLTYIAEAVTSIIFPLQWSVIYIPFIAVDHIHFIQSPSPYLIGVDSRFFDFFRLGGKDITCVDVDTGHLMRPQNYDPLVLDVKVLPEKPLLKLRSKLCEIKKRIDRCQRSHYIKPKQFLRRHCLGTPDSDLARSEFGFLQEKNELGGEVREAFRLFMAHLLKDYRRFLISAVDEQNNNLFDDNGFLHTLGENESIKFYQTLFATQQWVDFIRDRSYVSSRESALDRFDQLIANMSDCQLSMVGLHSLSSESSIRDNAFAHSLLKHARFPKLSHRNVPTSTPSSMNDIATRSIPKSVGPPIWPIPSNVPGFHQDLTSFQQSECSRTDSKCGSIPNAFDVTLLNRLAVCAHHLRSFDIEEPLRCEDNGESFGGIDPHPNRTIPGTTVVESDSTPLGLVGLPTAFPLPIDYSIFLQRSCLEIQDTAKCSQLARERCDQTWCNILIGTLYSLWFILLPAFLSTIRFDCSNSNSEIQSPEHSESSMLQQCIAEAVRMSDRLDKYKLSPVDQVRDRILLILLYQHRPNSIHLLDFMNKVHWSSGSWTLKNQINTCYLEERAEEERLSRRSHLIQTPLKHNRSSSICVGTKPNNLGVANLRLDTCHSEPSLCERKKQKNQYYWDRDDEYTPTVPTHIDELPIKPTLPTVQAPQSQPVARRNINNNRCSQPSNTETDDEGERTSLSSYTSNAPTQTTDNSGDNLSSLDEGRSMDSSQSNLELEHRGSNTRFSVLDHLREELKSMLSSQNEGDPHERRSVMSQMTPFSGRRFLQGLFATDGQRPINAFSTSDGIIPDSSENLRLRRDQSLCFEIGGDLIIGGLRDRLIPATSSTYSCSACQKSINGSIQRGSVTSFADIGASDSPITSVRSVTPNRTSNQTPNRMIKFALSVTTCNTCPQCTHFVYDEEIMGQWSPDETSTHIACPFCSHLFPPNIFIRVFVDLESSAQLPSSTSPSPVRVGSTDTPMRNIPLLELTHPYLSPMYLRSSLESVLQIEGTQCFHVDQPRNSLLYRHEDLTWNLVWYIHRLGLPTHLLDPFSAWLTDKQSELRRLGSLSNYPHIKVSNNNMLFEAVISANIPLYIILRWNHAQPQSRNAKPFYNQWLLCKREWKTTPDGMKCPSGCQPTPSDFNLYDSEICVAKRTLFNLWKSISDNQMDKAFEALVHFRSDLTSDTPRDSVYPPTSIVDLHHQRRPEAKVMSESKVDLSHQCTELHQSAWCLKGSLYREIQFFATTVVPTSNLDDIDEQYDAIYHEFYAKQSHSHVTHFDRAPGYIARQCRGMLRPLTLVP